MLALAVTASACGYEGEVFATGIARDLSDGRLAYCEYHLPAENDSRQVLYYNPEGNLIAKKYLKRVNSPLTEVFQLDLRHGEQRQVQKTSAGWTLGYQEKRGVDGNYVDLPAEDFDVIDAGFDVFVRQHWASLSRGEILTFNFASPVHGRKIGLRAQRTECKDSSKNSICISVDVAQPLLRLFAGSLYLQYDEDSRRLQVFEGVSNLVDARGKSQKVRIGYTYPESN
ncbi:hypothetical protein ACNKU7_14940 [Microbulbifer sp. SA54]|uniref:hypothetical protein n=1 Tax=Microbulbifer sp. SA54 TaxID=3401577 RepID=UPI003AAF48F7